jgi:processive 1,2-diacylglycerol beta-glucosyltransferase
VKKILILTASYGEGHNTAARGIRDGLAQVAPETKVEVHDLFIETYGWLNELIRKAYLTLINRWPRSWGYVYRFLEEKNDFNDDFKKFTHLKRRLAGLLERFQPDAIVSVFPAYPYLLDQIEAGPRNWRNVVVVTDSITVNRIWYYCSPDYFLVPNDESAAVLRQGGVAPEMIKTFGFPVSPRFATLEGERPPPPSEENRRVLYMINPATLRTVDLVRRLLDLDIQLTVTVGRNQQLDRAVRTVAAGRPIEIFGWTDQLPRILAKSHLLIGKAGGATVQEAIAAACPMIINHVVSGQEEGNAQLIVQTNSGVVAHPAADVAAQVQHAFADDAKQWREWHTNISRLSRPRASLDIAEFLLSL